MKNCSSIDTDDILYRIITEGVKAGKIKTSGIVCPQDEYYHGNARQAAKRNF